MNREDIIRWALEASGTNEIALTNYGDLHHFACLVAAAEREACAKVCEFIDEFECPLDASAVCGACANAIRARGENKV
jgi:hypothetical protein